MQQDAQFRCSNTSNSSSSTASSSRSLKAMISRRSVAGGELPKRLGDSFRKGSNRALSVGLQLEKLEELLCETSQNYCENDLLVQQIRLQFIGFANRKKLSNTELSHHELGDIIDTLKEILNTSPSLPPKLVSYFHSTIGLLRQQRGECDTAAHSFMKALWVSTATIDPQYEEIGLTLHRLGIARGRNGRYDEAVTLLEKSLAVYNSAGLPDNHPYVIAALSELDLLRVKLEKELWRRDGTSEFLSIQHQLESAGDRGLSL